MPTLSVTLLQLTVVAFPAAAQVISTPPYALKARFENSATAKANSPTFDQAQNSGAVSAHATGSEHSGCGIDYGRKSASVAAASGALVDQRPTSLSLSLASKASANGGHFRTYVSCVPSLGVGIGIMGNDTTATASGIARAVVTITFAPDAPRTNYFLHFGSTSSGSVLEADLVKDDQTRISLKGVSNSPPTLVGGPNLVYFLTLTLASQVQDEGNCCSKSVDAVGSAFIGLEAAPAAFGKDQTPLILGGKETGPDEYPEVGAISLIYADGVRFHCTGTLVSRSTVLTAAHCIKPFQDKIAAGEMVFTTGKFTTSPIEGPIKIRAFAFPQGPSDAAAGFSYNADKYEDDIGLLFLATPVIKVKNFPKRFVEPPGWASLKTAEASLTLVGFGYAKNPITGGLVDAGVKRYVLVPVNDFTNRKVSYRFNALMGGACHGDSGGPTYLTQNGTLIAVTSTNTDNCQGQGEQTRVDAFKAWIDPKIQP